MTREPAEKPVKVVVVGAGIGGLCAAIGLAAKGVGVQVWERAADLGGKAGTVTVDGIRIDTGPSLLTLPEAFDAALQPAGLRLRDLVTLLRPSPGFDYRWPDGVRLPVFHQTEATLASVREVLGADAAAQLARFLTRAAEVWRVASPEFVFADRINLWSVFSPRFFADLWALDPFRTMASGIARDVSEPHLRDLLWRYATYNGSDPRSAPATLNCVAHVELGLGGYGVKGGICALVDALVDVAGNFGVQFYQGREAKAIQLQGGRVCGVSDGTVEVGCDALICNADVGSLPELLPPGTLRPRTAAPSLSGWTGIYKSSGPLTCAHTVFFPRDYPLEFRDLFDQQRIPEAPTVYASAPSLAHQAPRWVTSQPLFVMVNAPPNAPDCTGADALVRARLGDVLTPDDPLVWQRTPADLATRFPGSAGAIYGPSSNSMLAAFERAPVRQPVPGLYLASGSGHPGGGLPLCALAGRAAARGVLATIGRSPA